METTTSAPRRYLLASCGGGVKVHSVRVLSGAATEAGVEIVADFAGAEIHSSLPVQGMCWNHSGQVLMSCSSDGTCALLKPQGAGSGGSCLGKLPVPKGQIGGLNAISLSLGSRYLACGGDDATVRVWDLKMKKTVRTIKDHKSALTLESKTAQCGKLRSVCFSMDDSCIASGGDAGIIMVHNLRTNKRVALLRPSFGKPATYPGARSLQFSPTNASMLASCHDNGQVIVWDTIAEKEAVKFSSAHRAACTDVCFSPTRATLLASVGLDKRILFLDTSNGGRVLKTVLAKEPLTAVSFSPCGNFVGVGTVGGTVHVYTVNGSAPIRTLASVHAPGPVNDVVFYVGNAKFSETSSSSSSSSSSTASIKKKNSTVASGENKEQSPLLANKLKKKSKNAGGTLSRDARTNSNPLLVAPSYSASSRLKPKPKPKPKVIESDITPKPRQTRSAASRPAEADRLARPVAAAQLSTPTKRKESNAADRIGSPAVEMRHSLAPELQLQQHAGGALHAKNNENAPVPSVDAASATTIETMFEDMRAEIKRDVQNMHLELLRQFQVQLSDISGLLNDYTTKFGDVVKENARLREENERLRNLY